MSAVCPVTLVHPPSNGNRRPILSVAPAFCNNDAELAILEGAARLLSIYYVFLYSFAVYKVRLKSLLIAFNWIILR